MSRRYCDCADPGCPCCGGKCTGAYAYTLYRIDMADRSGVNFCQQCGEDAYDSGVFTDEAPSNPEIHSRAVAIRQGVTS